MIHFTSVDHHPCWTTCASRCCSPSPSGKSQSQGLPLWQSDGSIDRCYLCPPKRPFELWSSLLFSISQKLPYRQNHGKWVPWHLLSSQEKSQPHELDVALGVPCQGRITEEGLWSPVIWCVSFLGKLWFMRFGYLSYMCLAACKVQEELT